MIKKILFVCGCFMLTSCKPEIPLEKVPLTQALSGGEKAPCENLLYGGFPQSTQSGAAPNAKKQKEKKVAPQTSFVCRDYYALNFDTSRNTSVWVVERLLASEQSSRDKNIQERDETRPDPALPPSKRSTKEDFIGIGYQKGFFAPPQDFLFTDIGYSHSYYTSNMFPQHPAQVPYLKNLEEWIRKKSLTEKDLVVISGPVYVNGSGLGWVGVSASKKSGGEKALRGKILVPTHIYKVVASPSTNRAIAFVVPNGTPQNPSSSLSSFAVPLSTLEQTTGLFFFPDLPSDKAHQIKQTSLQSWGL